MSTNKKPYKITLYLDERVARYRDPGFEAFQHSNIYTGNIRDSYSLFIRVYSRAEKKVKWFAIGMTFTLKDWELIENCNILKEKDSRIKHYRIKVDAFLTQYERYNEAPNTTLHHFATALKGKEKSVILDSNSLTHAWKVYMGAPGRVQSDSNRDHHIAAIKSFVSYLSHQYPKTKKEQDFLIQDIDHAFLNGYIEWFESPSNNTKAKSLNTAYSYLMDLQIVLNWATVLNLLDESHNPFQGQNAFKIPKRTRRAKEYTLNESQLKLILKAEPNSPDEQKAKDLFLLCFLMSGLRIMDVILLRKRDIKETKGEKYFDIMPMKTFRYAKHAEIKITSLIQKILDKYPGDGIFVLDCITSNENWNRKEVKRLAKNYSRKMVEPLKRFTSKIEGFEKEISWSYARFSVNHYLMINDLASRDQIAEMLAHSANTSKGYFDDVENQKFNIQQKLSDSFDEKKKKIPLGVNAKNSEKKSRK